MLRLTTLLPRALRSAALRSSSSFFSSSVLDVTGRGFCCSDFFSISLDSPRIWFCVLTRDHLGRSRQQIADSFGIQKFSLIRCLNQLQAEGLVEVPGKDIRLLKVDHFR